MPADVVLEGPAQKQFEKSPRAIQADLGKRAKKLAQDPHFGQYIPIADVHNKATLKKWERRVGRVRNLYKLELSDGWRAIYTTGSRGADRVVMILEVVDHKAYERLMGY
ncbi:MAG TPA: hypothetical protein VM370_10340 [Candidatus Thermoplasmatota archaeon]|nr:hypothetical protein [Candidatus Thermoplasmatota archaeon]